VWKQITKSFVACVGGALIDVIIECAKVVQVSLIHAVPGYTTQLAGAPYEVEDTALACLHCIKLELQAHHPWIAGSSSLNIAVLTVDIIPSGFTFGVTII